MTSKTRLVVPVVLAVLALVTWASAAEAQDRVRGNILGNESSMIGFANAEDTVVEEAVTRPAKTRAGLEGAPLRGPNTLSGPADPGGERDYLLGLTPGAAIGISDSLADRYENGRVEDAVMELTYQGGCDSPNGRLTVRTITNRSWSPFDVSWEDTTRSENGTLEISGSLLADVSISPSAAQNNPHITCNTATLGLEMEPLRRVLKGQAGGIAMFWQGEQELNLTTLNSVEPPTLDVNFTTNGPSVNNVTLPEGAPTIAATGERVTLVTNATDPQGLPSDGVEINVTHHGDGSTFATLEAQRSGDLFIAHETFPLDDEGLYDIEAVATDSDGWTDRAGPNASGPHLVADGSAPRIPVANLDAASPNTTVEAAQGETIGLTFNVSDLSCQVAKSPCGSWELVWRGLTLAEGNLTPTQRVETSFTLPRPGDTSARLVLEDAAGHVNETSWPLEVRDTVAPSARAEKGSLLAPDRRTTIENGTPLPLRFTIEDDLPVEASLLLDGTDPVERDLPDPDDTGLVDATLEAIPEGDYRARLILDDGVHTSSIDFGRLTVAPPGAPTVSIDLPGTRLGANASVPVTIDDRNLDPNKTSVVAEVNGLEVRPDVDENRRSDGQDLTVHLGSLSHADTVNLTVRARDAQGIAATARAQATVDARAPQLAEPDNRTWVSPDTQIRFEANDPGDGLTTITVDTPRSRFAGLAPQSVSVSRLVDTTGQLVPITVTLKDDLGNQRTRTVQLGVDDEPPSLSTTFTRDGLVVQAQDPASGVQSVQVSAGVNGDTVEPTETRQQSPSRYLVVTGPLTRGDTVDLAIKARDAVGQTGQLGTLNDPTRVTVPDRPPTVTLERVSATVAATGELRWNASDPDEDPIDVQLTITAPDGSTTESDVSAVGTHEIQPDDRGRYEATVQARSAGNTSAATTFFYLGPEGRITQVGEVPSEIEPSESLTVELTFPSPPQRVFVTAVDESNATTSATVEMEGSTARATFGNLPAGSYEVEATVVHESGATETVHIASVDADQPFGEQVGDLLVPLLIALALILVVAIAVLAYRRHQEEQEEEQAEEAPP